MNCLLTFIIIVLIIMFFMQHQTESFGPFEQTAYLQCLGLPRNEKIKCIKANYPNIKNVCNQQFCKNLCMKEIDGVMIDVTNNPSFKQCSACNNDPCGFYCSNDPDGYVCKVSCKNPNICNPMQYIDELGDIPINIGEF